ncbi:hypothetical protein E2C01_072244 [Portunus trituberculatus]|uniref:Uncharacterized protein n=1 Tax=Portunus trituberculatus TaxID=210409 RepID=A0A5B7IA77_PORTR|nr:hypothetical protein [Portunus trituberculatus]
MSGGVGTVFTTRAALLLLLGFVIHAGPPWCSGTARALWAPGFSSAGVGILATVRG